MNERMHDDWGFVTPYGHCSEILSGLFQGGTKRSEVIDRVQPLNHFDDVERKFDCIATLYAYAAPAGWGVEERRLGFPDAELTDEYISQLEEMAEWAFTRWQEGKRVLVRCAAGLNRSGLITALVLMRAGHSADDAVSLIRERRSADALFNHSFVQYLQRRQLELQPCA